jgi:hypothetical protein
MPFRIDLQNPSTRPAQHGPVAVTENPPPSTQKGTTVELIIMLLAPLPIGYFLRNRIAAYLAYIALHSFVFTFQSTILLKEWNGGDYSAFVKNPAAVDWSYGLVNLLIFAAGLGLVTLGSWLSARRRRPAPPAVNLAE